MISVLSIDDDPEIYEILQLYLAEIAEVVYAPNVKQALMQVRSRKFDVILLDIEMPIMNGFKILEQLRNVKECVNIPVIMLTAKQDKYYNAHNTGIYKPLHKAGQSNPNEACSKHHYHGSSRKYKNSL